MICLVFKSSVRYNKIKYNTRAGERSSPGAERRCEKKRGKKKKKTKKLKKPEKVINSEKELKKKDKKNQNHTY